MIPLLLFTSLSATITGDVTATMQQQQQPSDDEISSSSYSIFANCTMSCGWIAAIISVISFGSFGVPIRHSGHHAHPMIMQSYKTFVCFLTCWFVILLGEPIRWTYWGLLSGLFWVPGATCGIYGIRYAGLAVAVGTWSSIIVITSFLFGIIVFQESVHSLFGAICAFTLLMTGLIGMSRYSSSPAKSSELKPHHMELVPVHHSFDDNVEDTANSTTTMTTASTMTMTMTPTKSTTIRKVRGAIGRATSFNAPLQQEIHTNGMDSSTSTDNQDHINDESNGMSTIPLLSSSLDSTKRDDMENSGNAEVEGDDDDDDDHYDHDNKRYLVFWNGRISLTRRQVGIMGAIINGSWGGMNLIPLHYARKQNHNLTGAGYIISYACGSMVIQILLWLVVYLYHLLYKTKQQQTTTLTLPDHSYYYYRMIEAYEMLPKFRNDLIKPGLLAGLLYSIGNFASIIAVSYLGQGTGFSFCQMTLLVSGLWGIFYFHEIQDPEYICKWFLSACVAIIGIIWLSYEHASGASGH